MNKVQARKLINQSNQGEEKKQKFLKKIDDFPGPDIVNVSSIIEEFNSKKSTNKKSRFEKLRKNKKVDIDSLDIA